ncbi:MAG: tetratricopeptide repeat protein [Anaerolineae bacterium]|nr:tetratricopeptide repeat protein [Anaerolineae bacterium]
MKLLQDPVTTLQVAECFSQKSLRHALRLLDVPQELGKQPLAYLNIVRLQCTHAEPDSRQRGTALRDILQQAITNLKPNEGAVNVLESAWYPYLILSRQYLEGCSPTYLTQKMCIARSTYFQEQKRALSLLAETLQQMELECNESPAVPTRHPPPFLAPPRPIYSLVGRDRLLEGLKQRMFADGQLLFSAITGLPGVGKTALAIELAHDPEVLEHFADGMLWAGLGRRPDIFALLGIWGTALDIPANEISRLFTVEQRAQRIHTAIGVRRMLLVIDDAWQAETALAFKIGGPNCAYLLTTRIPEVALAFADAGVITAPELDEDDSVTLLGRMAPQAVAEKPKEAHALARAVGGLPLALTLMGWHLREETHGGHPRRLQNALKRLQQTAARLQISQPQTLLERRSDLAEGTPLSLQVAIGISDETLNPTAWRALRALSVFPPKPSSFSEAAALAVTAAPVETLDTLMDRGLLESVGPDRYTLHQTISDYAGLHCTDDSAQTRMSDYFIAYAETYSKDYPALTQEINNLITALEMAFECGTPSAIKGANALYEFLEARGHYEMAKKLLNKAEWLARDDRDAANLSTTLRNLGRIMMKKGDFAQAEIYLQEGLILAREIEQPELLGAILFNLGAVADYRGDFDRAEVWYEESLELARKIGDMERVAWLLSNLGGMSACRGQYERAATFCQEGLETARAITPQRKELLSALLTNLGLTAKKQGDYERAASFYRESLTLAQEIGHRERVIELLCNLGNIALEKGEYAQADTLYKRGIALAQEINLPWLICGLLISQSELHLKRRYLNAATISLQQALKVSKENGTQDWTGLALFGLAQVAAEKGEMTQARQLGEEGLAVLQAIGHGDAEQVDTWLRQIA